MNDMHKEEHRYYVTLIVCYIKPIRFNSLERLDQEL